MARSREVERRRLERLAQLRQRIDSEPDPDRRRARAVDLLAPGAGRFELSVALEALVAHVEEPTAGERVALRATYRRLAESDLDHSGVLRTHALRLLGRGPEPSDRDLLVEAARTFCADTGVDTSGELRGLALLALLRVDPETARWLAAERLHDPEPPNEQPHATALRILAAAGEHLLIRAWLDGPGTGAQPVAVAADAEADLALAMPASEWAARAARRLGDGRAVATLSAADAAVRHGRTELAAALGALLRRVGDPDLFRALATTLAAAREAAFIEALLDLVEEVPTDLLDVYTDALGVCRSPRRDPVLSRVSARAREAHARRREGGME
jgi:hypothetical protein